MPNNFSRCLVALAMLFCCHGCIESEHALSDPDSAELVLELMGTWIQDPPDDESLWTIAATGDGFPKGMHRLTVVENGRTEGKLFFVSNIGDRHYANILNFEDDSSLPTTWQPKLIKNYTLIQFEVKDSSAKLLEIKETVLEASIRKGELRGRESKQPDVLEFDLESDVDAWLSSPTLELNRYFGSNGKLLTGKAWMKYQKQK